MTSSNLRLLLALLFCLIVPFSIDARGRGGGGGMARSGGGGGGMPRGGGNFSGGGGFSGGAQASRSPSMSRAVPSQPRMASPQMPNRSPIQGGASANRIGSPNASIPRAGAPGANLGAGASGGLRTPPSGGSAIHSPNSFQQPSRGQLDSFLSGSGGSSAKHAGSTSTSGTSTGQSGGSRTHETARGGTITVGGGSRSGVTEGGTTVGGAAGGIKIETAGGNTIVRGTGAVGATDGQNSAIAAGSRTGVETAAGGQAVAGRGVRAATDGTNSAVRAGGAVAARDASGNSAVAARGGYADSSGYRQGGAVTARQNQWGYTSVNARAGYGVGGTGQVVSKSAVRGPAGNVVSGGRGASYVNGQFVGGHAYTAVNGSFTRWGYFTPAYYGRYPGAWFPGKWAITGTAWAAVTWATAGSYCGCVGGGTYYDYEQNVTYDNSSVLYEGQPVATAVEYYQQADTIADAGAQSQDAEWLPLGVFAIIAETDQTKTDKVIQLALNHDGAIRGNFQDMLTEQVTPVSGSVDKKSERVALKLEGNDSMVMEIGLYNLTNDEVPALVHFDAEHREPRTLIRLKNPEEKAVQ